MKTIQMICLIGAIITGSIIVISILRPIIKTLWETLKDPDLLSSRPHHGEESDDRDPEWDEDPIDYCFITNKPLTTYPMYFCNEFDCYISEEGYQKVMEHKYCPEHESACELCIIKGEFSQHVDVLA
tara:strand:+ start:17266 stop:17646 length:381 start_codon:yes stop_codon:yes gene_type:complete